MANLFGGTPMPRWMEPEERQSILHADGRAMGQSFSQAFSRSFAQATENQYDKEKIADQRKYEEEQRNKTMAEMQPVIGAMTDVKSWEDMTKKIGENPQWLMNPRTAPIVANAFKTWTAAEGIKAKSSEAVIGRQSAQAFGKMVQGLANKGPDGAILAGKYAGAMNQVPTDETLKSFGEDLAKLGLSQRDLIEKSGLPLTKISQGPTGTTVEYKDSSANYAPPNIVKLLDAHEAAVAAGEPPEKIKALSDAITKANSLHASENKLTPEQRARNTILSNQIIGLQNQLNKTRPEDGGNKKEIEALEGKRWQIQNELLNARSRFEKLWKPAPSAAPAAPAATAPPTATPPAPAPAANAPAAATPPAATAPIKPTQANVDAIIKYANEAIKKGHNREKVLAEANRLLKESGVQLKE